MDGIEIENENSKALPSFYYYKHKTSSIKLFLESEIDQDPNSMGENHSEFQVVMFSYAENLSLQPCLIEFSGNSFNLKEILDLNRLQNKKLVL